LLAEVGDNLQKVIVLLIAHISIEAIKDEIVMNFWDGFYA